MITKRFGDFIVPAIGQGAGGNDVCADSHRIRVLQYGIDLGMTLIDTAEAYRGGHSEEIVGKAIAGNRGKVFISTKFSPEHNHRQGVQEALEGSLGRLKTDYVDLYQVHWPNPSVPIEETMQALVNLKAAGKVLHIGVSNFSLPTLLRAQEACSAKIVANQVEYNLLERGVEEELLPHAEKNGIMITAYQPLLRRAKGSETLDAIARSRHGTPSQAILAWLASHPNVVPIPKTLNLEHVRENAQAAELRLTPEEIVEIDQAFKRTIVEVPTDKIRVLSSDKEPVYTTLVEAIENRVGLVPSPQALAEDILASGILKPVHLRPIAETNDRYAYDLTQGRVRYWAWIMAHGQEVPIPAYIVE